MKWVQIGTLISATVCLGIIIAVPREVSAGCCTVVTTVPQTGSMQTVYINTDTDQKCTERNGINTRATYLGDHVSIDNQKCQPLATQDATTTQQAPAKPILPQLQVSIPGFKGFSEVKCNEEHPECATPWLAEYIRGMYDYGLIIIALLSAIVLMVGGVIRLTAGGNRGQIGTANDLIKGSIMGMILAFASYAILFLLNPNLTILQPIEVSSISRIELEKTDATNNHGLPPEPKPNGLLEETTPSGQACKESERINVPNDVNGLGILDQSGQQACPDAIVALKKAAQCMRAINPKYIIRVSSASRTLQRQRELYAQNPREACNPAGGGCPHTSGVAFDAWGCGKGDGGACKYTDLQGHLQDCMVQSGFCLLSFEAWHFENPKFSSACGTSKHFKGSHAQPIDPNRNNGKSKNYD